MTTRRTLCIAFEIAAVAIVLAVAASLAFGHPKHAVRYVKPLPWSIRVAVVL
jgi:hypothetical protein